MTATPSRDRPKCNAVVWKKDTYRVARGTKSGFAMHYDRKQCSRLALEGCEFCRQHQSAAERWGYVEYYGHRPTTAGATPSGERG